MVKDELIVPIGHEHIIDVNGKKYRAIRFYSKRGDVHSGRLIYKPIDEKQYESRVNKVVEYTLNRIGKKLSVKQILKEALMGMEMNDFNRIEKRIKKKSKPKVNPNGCISIDFGGSDHVRII